MTHTRLAKAFIGFMVLAAAGTIGNAVSHRQSWHPYLALTLLAVAVATSRMKVTIPGIDGNMSVNLPFLLLSVITLSATESILIVCASTLIQTLPKDGSKLKPVRVLFNVSMMTFASGAAAMLVHQKVLGGMSRFSAPLLLAAITATFFLGQTLPVSVIVALTDGGAIRRTWINIAHMSFPYYVVSAGVTSMVSSVGHHIGWLATLLLLPVMYGIHLSYRLYFARAVQAVTQPMAMAAGAGAHS
jgi:hypothetical protein